MRRRIELFEQSIGVRLVEHQVIDQPKPDDLLNQVDLLGAFGHHRDAQPVTTVFEMLPGQADPPGFSRSTSLNCAGVKPGRGISQPPMSP